MDFLTILASIAQIFSVIWVLLFGSETLKDVIQKRSFSQRFVVNGVFVFVIVLLFFMPVLIKTIGLALVSLLGFFIYFWKTRAWFHNKLLQNPPRNIRLLQYIIFVLIVYSLLATILFLAIFPKTSFFSSSFPVKPSCAACDRFNSVITYATIDKDHNATTLHMTINFLQETDHFQLESSLISADKSALHGENDQCKSSYSCLYYAKQSLDINITFAFLPSPMTSYTLYLTAICIESSPTHFEPIILNF